MGFLSRYRHGSAVVFTNIIISRMGESGDVSQPGGSVVSGPAIRKNGEKLVNLIGFDEPVNVKLLDVIEVGR